MDTICIFAAEFWRSLWSSHGERVIAAATRILAILVAYIVVRFAVFKIIRRLTVVPLTVFAEEVMRAREARVRALETALRSTVGFVLGFIAIVMILQAAGVNIVPLLTTASVAGLAVGFGAQTLVRDVISGFFILMEDQYGVGDYVTIGAVTGVVQELGMRTTRIRDNAGRLYIISNGSVGQVCNHSRGAFRATFDISVPVESDLEMAKAVLNEAGNELAERMPDLIRGPLACDGFIQITGATATIRMTGSIAPERQEDVHMALLDAVRRAFADNDLKLA